MDAGSDCDTRFFIRWIVTQNHTIGDQAAIF
jgi:hypothetical protein